MSAAAAARARRRASAASEWAAIAGPGAAAGRHDGAATSPKLATFLAPRSVEAADNALRQFARWLLEHTDVAAVADIGRSHVEDYKVWLAAQPGDRRPTPVARTRNGNGCGCSACSSNGSSSGTGPTPRPQPDHRHGDIPPRPEPLPKFLDDRDAARLMAAARAAADPRDRLVVEILARTGLRASELCDLDADAVVLIGDGHWLRVPVGKLRNDRYVPLHPDLVALLADWTATNLDHIRRHRRLVADHRGTARPPPRRPHRAPRRPPRRRRTPTPTSSATPSPPKPSTGACASKRSPPCSVTARWR